LRITFLLPVVSMSGGNKVIAIYARELRRLGHTVTIVSPPPKKSPLKEKVRSFLKGNGWPVDAKVVRSHLDGTGLDHMLLDRWRPITNDDVQDSDVVIATWWETAEWVNTLDPEKGAKVYFVQGHEIFPHLPIARCRATYRLPLHKIVVSGWLKNLMKSEYGDEIVDLVPNSVDKEQFFAAPRSKNAVPSVGFLYSSLRIKGLDITLAALKKVRQRRPQLRLISFGASEPVPKLPLLDGTEFFHSPKQDEIRNLYCSCDLWVSGSRTEGFNLTAIEAMACRTPVVSTRTGWPADVIKSGWNGFLVEIDDIDELASKVESVLSQSSEEWQAMSSNAYATVTNSSWARSAGMLERALEHACERAGRGEIAGKCPRDLKTT
jgi:glycosyltransferase involved in cell wall biosynthesis